MTRTSTAAVLAVAERASVCPRPPALRSTRARPLDDRPRGGGVQIDCSRAGQGVTRGGSGAEAVAHGTTAPGAPRGRQSVPERADISTWGIAPKCLTAMVAGDEQRTLSVSGGWLAGLATSRRWRATSSERWHRAFCDRRLPDPVTSRSPTMGGARDARTDTSARSSRRAYAEG